MFDVCPICESEPVIKDDLDFDDHVCVICETCGFLSEPVPKGKDQEKRLAEQWMEAIDDYNRTLLGLNVEF